MVVPRLLCFDLAKSSGWATFVEGRLVQAGYGTFDFLARQRHWADEEYPGTLVLIETPHHAWRATTEDVIKLGIMVGKIEERYERRGCRVERVKPVEWKGSVDADVMTARILKRLTLEELKLVPVRPRAADYEHNAVDAIGLGLWKLGRMHG